MGQVWGKSKEGVPGKTDLEEKGRTYGSGDALRQEGAPRQACLVPISSEVRR